MIGHRQTKGPQLKLDSAWVARVLQSWMHAWLKAMDRATMVAIVAVREDAHAHDSTLSYLWGPFGLWRRRARHRPYRPQLSSSAV